MPDDHCLVPDDPFASLPLPPDPRGLGQSRSHPHVVLPIDTADEAELPVLVAEFRAAGRDDVADLIEAESAAATREDRPRRPLELCYLDAADERIPRRSGEDGRQSARDLAREYAATLPTLAYYWLSYAALVDQDLARSADG